MPNLGKFCLSWQAGSSAQIELFNPLPEGGGIYQIKYTPPFRSTIRPPIRDMRVGPTEIDMLGQLFNKLMGVRGSRGAVGGAPPPPSQPISKELVSLGKVLFSQTISPYIRPDIAAPGLFFEIGLEEPLLGYPWELMHDGDQFLCLKHFMGRFVNSTEKIPDANRLPESYQFNTPLDKISILLIVVPKPLPRPNGEYDALPEAEAEADAIIEALAGQADIELTVRMGPQATLLNIASDLSRGGFHIVHFCGHAKFDEKHPRLSSLILHDKDMTTGWLYSSIIDKPPVPVFCFVNACETARANLATDPASGNVETQMNVFSLARALLEAGTYLLGTRWKVNDTAAKHFAGRFYTSLLIEGKPLGEAIRDARIECKAAIPDDDFGWGSYVLYGDPRVQIYRT